MVRGGTWWLIPGSRVLGVLTSIHALVEGLRNGSLRPVIAQEFPLARTARTEAVMEAGHHGKMVLVP